MPASKDIPPFGYAFFPRIFFRNQFQSQPKWPPHETDLTGRTAIVTGANQGLGLEASRQLLSLKLSRLIIAVRSVSKGDSAARELRSQSPGAVVDVIQLDMSSYESIRAFAAQTERLEHLDIVILNAGVRKTKFEVVPDTGHEETIQVNYLSTVLLCLLLLPVLKRKTGNDPGRMTIIGSGLAFGAKFKTRNASPLLGSLDEVENFDAFDRYETSKLLCLMFLYSLEQIVAAEDVVINVVDPGFVRGTSLSRDLPYLVSVILGGWKLLAARSVEVGASTYIDAAVTKGVESHGCYIMSWEISP